MTWSNQINDYEAAIIDVFGGTFRGEDILVPGSGNAHHVAQKILELDGDSILSAHPVYGGGDLIVFAQATEQSTTKQVIRQIRTLAFGDRHNFIKDTLSHLATELFSKRELVRHNFQSTQNCSAWIRVKLASSNPASGPAQHIMGFDEVSAVVPVLGSPFDLFVLVETTSFSDLKSVIDGKLRAYRYVTETQTGLIA